MISYWVQPTDMPACRRALSAAVMAGSLARTRELLADVTGNALLASPIGLLLLERAGAAEVANRHINPSDRLFVGKRIAVVVQVEFHFVDGSWAGLSRADRMASRSISIVLRQLVMAV